MELLTLDGNYQPSELVERYGSLIWTERYFTAGDFQLVTTDIERMIKLMPLESVVTIRESTVPMVVETYKIEKPINSAPTLTITGRSFETVLERRVTAKRNTEEGPRVAWFEVASKEPDAAYQAIRKILGDGIRTLQDGVTTLPAETPMLSLNDALPMLDLIAPKDYVIETDPTKQIEIKPGNLYSTVLELIATRHRGIKAVRPVLGESKVGIEIFNGADLTNEVVFDARFDQFEAATYLLSELASTNWAYVFSSSASQSVSKTTLDEDHQEPTGLDRRVLYVDISSEEGTNSPEARNTRGLIELYKNNATALFDGQISQQVAAGYNRDYFLGDIIRLDGEYGLSQNVRVAEFIRSDDNTGSKAYPTFEMVTP